MNKAKLTVYSLSPNLEIVHVLGEVEQKESEANHVLRYRHGDGRIILLMRQYVLNPGMIVNKFQWPFEANRIVAAGVQPSSTHTESQFQSQLSYSIWISKCPPVPGAALERAAIIRRHPVVVGGQ